MSASDPGAAAARFTFDVRVVHRCAHLLVLDKPSGLPTTAPKPKPGRRAADCLTDRAQALDPDAPRLHVTSRLDVDVSGLVTFARTRAANDALLAARREGTYSRLYLALTLTPPPSRVPSSLASRAHAQPACADTGSAPSTSLLWDWPIGIHPRDKRMRIARRDGPATDKASRTRCEVAARTHLGALLHLRPDTGRTHQLRVHALAAGCPLFGDRVYGAPTRAVAASGAVVTARRVMLHCAALQLPSVDGRGGTLTLRAAPPRDFERAFVGLGGDPQALLDAEPLGPGDSQSLSD